MNILITGASKGIGRATAQLLDVPGNKLFLAARSKDSFTDEFKHAELFASDLTKPDEIKQLVKDISDQAGHIDVLINNAGVYSAKRFEDMSDDDIILTIDLILRAHVLLTRATLPLLKSAEKPHIVFMSSMAAKSSIEGESVYSAAKSGITNFANVLRNELSPGVRVSAVHAWGVDTWGADKPEDFIRPEDVAQTMQFIITRSDSVVVESIDLGNPKQWRGGHAPWSP